MKVILGLLQQGRWGMGRWPKILLIFLLGWPAGWAKEATWQTLAQTFPQILNRAAADFSLPDLQGKVHQLSKQKGQWTLLVFWATWCGVCRGNLPQVQALHEKLPALAIWGISLDQGPRSLVAQEVARDQLKFLILHDAQGVTSAPYQTSAIPVAYLISPALKIVASIAGNFGWDQPVVVENLQKIMADTQLGEPPAVLAAQHASLPGERLAVPELDLHFTPPQTLAAKIAWPDAALKYRIKVPRLALPPGVKIKNVAAKPGSNSLTYVYTLEFSGQSKEFFVGPVTMTFTDHLGRGEQSARHPGIKITRTTSQISRWALGLGGLLGLLAGGGGWIVWRRRKNKLATLTNGQANPILTGLPATWMTEVADLKHWQLEHAPTEYAVHVLELCRQGQAALGHNNEETAQLLMNVKYGGKTLSAAELAYYEKILQQVCQQIKQPAADDEG